VLRPSRKAVECEPLASGDTPWSIPSAVCGEPSVFVVAAAAADVAADAALSRLWGEACKVTRAGAGEDVELDVRVPVSTGRSVVVPRTLGRCAWFHFGRN